MDSQKFGTFISELRKERGVDTTGTCTKAKCYG